MLRRHPAALASVARQTAGLVDLAGRVVALGDQVVVLGVPVQAAQRGDQVLGGAAPAAGVASRHRMRLDVGHHLTDLRRRRLVQAAGAPLLDHPVPVGAVGLAGAVGDSGGHDRHVVGEGGDGGSVSGSGGQVVGGQAQPLESQQRGVNGGLL